MYLLPSENYTLIIQTFAEKEPESCEIKINVTRGKNTYCKYKAFSAKKATCRRKIKARQGHKI